MFVTTHPSPLGTIVMESDGEVLTALRFGAEQVDMQSGDSGNGTAPHSLPTQESAVFDEVRRWLNEYFSGKRTENAVMGATTDGRISVRPEGTAFQKRVWQALLSIPYGETVSYGELARMVGCKSAQAVGQAVGANPIALIIPCHRVIAANGQLGGYAYGIELKRHLLEWEKSPTETFAMRTRCERE